MKWQPFPMIRIAGFFTGGVLLGIYQTDIIPLEIAASIVVAAAVLFFCIHFFSKENRNSVYSGFFGLILIFFLGYSRLLLFSDSRNDNHISKIADPIIAYVAVVRSVPEEKAKSWKVEMEVTQAKTSHWTAVTGRLLLYVSKKGGQKLTWHFGDRILVKGSPQELSSPLNPFEFDFKAFLRLKNISHQQFVSINEVKLIEETSNKGFTYYSHQARAWCLRKLNQFVHGDDERGIASALVLGVTDGIDNDLQNAYAASGAMHVLAVSGMHVGIIYAIILFLFKPVDKLKNSKWIVALVSLICLWSFSFITGNSPSVLRAVTMFSFIALARPFGKRTNIYNTLAASVFVLLIYKPYLIMSVGFQLSYLAVLGIVYLQRPLYQLWAIENKVGDWVWNLTCVSIAAQIATFVIGLLYFHQFPTYFLISNMIVVPLSTFVLLGGILLLAVSAISPLASLVGVALEWMIKALNWTVFTTEALPLSVIDNIYITEPQCWLLLGILISFVLLFQFRSSKWLYSCFVLSVLFSVSQWWYFKNEVNQTQMIAYSINNHHAVEFIAGGKSYFVSDSALLTDQQKIRFHVEPNRLNHGVSVLELQVPFGRNEKRMKFFRWQGRTIAYLDEKASLPKKMDFDYLIVGRNSLSREQLALLNVKELIFDGTNSKKYVEMMGSVAELNKISIHSVLKDGAFIIQKQ
ncbi:MAG TPA: ComEC/Rec2 family competence protein [Cyclobacteriaceae bacterium]|nr:ComEC/Rec2 family competence protein [Cyclobacteriaceae bacterium]